MDTQYSFAKRIQISLDVERKLCTGNCSIGERFLILRPIIMRMAGELELDLRGGAALAAMRAYLNELSDDCEAHLIAIESIDEDPEDDGGADAAA